MPSQARIWLGKVIPFFGPGGRGKRAILSASRMNELVATANAWNNIRLSRGENDRVTITDQSVFLQLKSTAGGGPGNTKAIRMLLVDVAEEYLTCHTFDGSTEGSTPIYVLRPQYLGCPATATIVYGVTYSSSYSVTYTYASVVQRTATATDFDDELQVIFPPYRYQVVGEYPGDEIFTAEMDNPVTIDGNLVTHIDLNVDARAWCTVPVDPIP